MGTSADAYCTSCCNAAVVMPVARPAHLNVHYRWETDVKLKRYESQEPPWFSDYACDRGSGPRGAQ